MKKQIMPFAILIALLTLTISCKHEQIQIKENVEKAKTEKIKTDITVKELQQKMNADSSLVILDVRTPPELTGPLGHIDGVINIPVQALEDNMDKIEKYRDKTIYVICRSGNRSAVATKMLIQKGFKAINVLGGMREYNKIK